MSNRQTLERVMFNKIVIGIDGLDGGQDALVLARMIARSGGELVLAHAYASELMPSRAAERDYEALVRDDAARMLEALAPPETPSSTLVVGDSYPGRALHYAATETGADLIVIGSCRRGVVGRVLLGDVSRATLHDAPCPVAVASRGYRMRAHRPKTIGAAFIDTAESHAALELAAGLARDTGAELRVLTAAATPPPFMPGYAAHFDAADVHEARRVAAHQALEAAVAALDVPAQAEIVDDEPAAALRHLSRRVDVLVCGSRGWGAARRVVLGSTTDRLVHRAGCPVIVVPRPALAAMETESERALSHA